MKIIKNDKSVFFDVDDTLIIWAKDGHTWIPHKPHIELLKRFSTRNQKVFVWSAGGYEWATQAVKLLGLEKYVHFVLSKPTWWVDDLPANEVLTAEGEIYLPETKSS